MNKKRVHLVGADLSNQLGLECFIKNAFIQFGWDVIETSYRVMSKEEISTRIRYVTDAEFTLVIKGERICPEDVFACRIPTVLYMQDSVEGNKEAHFVIQTKSPLFDLVYTFNDYELPFYRQFNKNSYFLPLGADQLVHRQIENKNKTIEVGFCGNLNTNRINMINYLLYKGIPVQYSYSTEKYAEIVSNTRININIGITPTGIQQRIFETMCMGGFLITNKLQGGTEIFKDKDHLVYYKDFDELVTLCYNYINEPNEMNRISENGRNEVLKNHLYINRVQQIVGDVCRMKK